MELTDDHYSTCLYDYSEAANPVLSSVPIETFSIYDNPNKAKVRYFDNSRTLNVPYKATSPNLLSAFLVISKDNSFEIDSNMHCSSQLFYIIKGTGFISYSKGKKDLPYSTGDLITTPFYDHQYITALNDTEIYWVSDYPLLQYMGLKPVREIIPPTVYKKKYMESFLQEICEAPGAEQKNRTGILLGNTITEKWGTKTLSHILWALLNKIAPNSIQKPHRHNSVALDYCVYSNGTVYTIMGEHLNEDGSIQNPVKVYWVTGSCFTTPPGWWHSHVNEGNESAIVLPVQDAGLYTYQRTLNIQFSNI